MDGFAHVLARHARPVGRRLAVALIALAAFAVVALPTHAQEDAVIHRGDAAVTGFSGAKVWGKVPADVHPLDVTFLDTGGPVLRVFDLTKLGGPPAGELANAPSIFQALAGDVGQVFGVTLDSETVNRTPNIYVTATSLFGLQIVSKEGTRLVKGERGARWMPGQFGVPKGGGPGSIWKIDGASGAISLFANIKHDGQDNAGPGLGDAAYDPATNQLFVTDLETGLIHRLGLDGSDRGTFDHGTTGRAKAGLEAIAYDAASRMSIESPNFDIEDPFTWGFADARRRVFAVAVENGRLYYSVAKPLQIWSVGINADGSFADDARPEIDVKDTPSGNSITDIVFDGPGTLYLSQRGELTGSYDYSIFAKLQSPVVRRYAWNDGDKRWSEDPGEFAIGLKTPYRSTDGGIALNYGYDANGNIDYGKCRETLWTTGEHLREGEDKDRTYKGGARVVHGLQATSKANIRPANEPPYETWFVDSDGQYDDPDFYSRVGDIAIYDPCDTLVAAEPEAPYSPPPGPPPGGPSVWIKKECAPAPFGGHIHCVITVTNSGSTTPEAPVSIWDAATILAGPGAGGAVIIDTVAPDIPQWVCSPTPTANLSCTLAPDLLPPGSSHSIEVTVDTGPLLAAGNHGFHNCASLGAPWYGEACADGGTSIVILKTAPAACVPGADCTFGVTITNTGSLPFSGDVVLSDSIFTPIAPMVIPIASIVPPLGCAPAPGALPFSCVAPLALAPGESKAFAMTLTMPVGPPPGYWAHNCISASAPGVVPPALPPPPGDVDSAVSCAWVPVGAPLALSNLRLQKTALHAGKCFKAPGDIILCDYQFSVINDGPSPYHGLITVNETVPAAATLTVGDPTWACAGGPPLYACNPLAAVDIAVGGVLTVPVQISIPLAPLEGAGCALPNTAAIVAPAGGADTNYDAGDDADTAIADALLTWVDGFGVTHVTCDPSNLKTTKVAKGDCVESGGDYLCEYIVTVTNTGPDPYHGPLKLNEQLGFAPTSVSFSPPWSCVGGGASYQCTYPHVDLEVGLDKGVALGITVKVPGGRQCELVNRAATTFPWAGTRFNTESGDDFAAATSKIPAKRCDKPDRPSCDPGPNELRTESGACVCKSGYIRDGKRGCVGIIEPVRCADGTPVPKSGHCPGTTPTCEPGPNEYRNDEGRCVCKRGYERDERGRCEKPSPVCEPGPNEYRNDEGRCICKRGYERDANKRCVEPKCEPGPNEYRNESGQCVCKQGFERDANKRCVTSSNPAEDCKKKGWTWTGTRCIEPKCEPGPNEYRNDDGQCVCKKGFERDANKRCVTSSNPAEDCKKKGWTWTGKRCVEPPNPADECRKKGWTWDGKKCIEPPNPAAECRKKGWNWDGKKCIEPSNPAVECRKKGWNWDGKKCVEPPKKIELKKIELPNKTCPAGTVGTPPNCKAILLLQCPAGTTGVFPNCKKIQIQ